MAEHLRKRVRSQGLTRFSRTQKAAGAACAALAVTTAVAMTWGGQDPSPAAAPRPTATPAATTATATPTPTPTATPTPTPTKSASRTTPPARADRATPMTFSAPTIDVRGKLHRTLAHGGVVNPPAGVLAWISGYGRVRPGEVGTAVIAGHVVDGRRADVFANLEDIDRGDKVTVVDAKGRTIVYTVTATRVATKQAVSLDRTVWGANTSVRRIALITCDDEDGYRADGHRVSNFVAIAEAR